MNDPMRDVAGVGGPVQQDVPVMDSGPTVAPQHSLPDSIFPSTDQRDVSDPPANWSIDDADF